MYNITTIIVAGGSGTRMGSELPKQFLTIANRPILMHTIDSFAKAIGTHQIIVVLPADSTTLWQQLCQDHSFTTDHKVVVGGDSRFASVKNGIAEVDSDSNIVLIHDGVRPLVSSQLIKDIVEATAHHGTSIPYVEEVNSLRKILPDGSTKIVDRSLYIAIQTPQGFKRELLERAYDQPSSPLFTDDASVVESAGHKIHLTRGEVANIKITTPTDLLISSAILSQ